MLAVAIKACSAKWLADKSKISVCPCNESMQCKLAGGQRKTECPKRARCVPGYNLTQQNCLQSSSNAERVQLGASSGGHSRAAELEPFIQEQCSDAVQSMAQQLDAQLQGLGQPGMDLDGAKLVEQALLIGSSVTWYWHELAHSSPGSSASITLKCMHHLMEAAPCCYSKMKQIMDMLS